MSKHCAYSGCSGGEFQGGLCRKHMPGSEGSKAAAAQNTTASTTANPEPSSPGVLLSDICHDSALRQVEEKHHVDPEAKTAKSKIETQQLFDDGMAAIHTQQFPLASQKFMCKPQNMVTGARLQSGRGCFSKAHWAFLRIARKLLSLLKQATTVVAVIALER